MRVIALIIAVLFFFACSSALGNNKMQTIIKDWKEASLLLGQHIFMSLSAKELDYYWQGSMPGHVWIMQTSAEATKIMSYKILAQTETHGDEACDVPYAFGDSLHISGIISEIRTLEFDIQGTITAGYYPNTKFEEKSGTFTFSERITQITG